MYCWSLRGPTRQSLRLLKPWLWSFMLESSSISLWCSCNQQFSSFWSSFGGLKILSKKEISKTKISINTIQIWKTFIQKIMIKILIHYWSHKLTWIFDPRTKLNNSQINQYERFPRKCITVTRVAVRELYTKNITSITYAS